MKWLKRIIKVVILLPIMALFELILVVVVTQVTFFSVTKAVAITDFAVNHLPSYDWYFKE